MLPTAGDNGLLFHGSNGVVRVDARTGETVWTASHGSTASATYAMADRLIVWDGPKQDLLVVNSASGTPIASCHVQLPPCAEDRIAWIFGGSTSNQVTLVRQNSPVGPSFDITGIDVETGDVLWRRPMGGFITGSWPLLTRLHAYWVSPEGALSVLDTADGTVTNVSLHLPPISPHDTMRCATVRPSTNGTLLVRHAASDGKERLLFVAPDSGYAVTEVDWPDKTNPATACVPMFDVAAGVYRMSPSESKAPTHPNAFLLGGDVWSLTYRASGNLLTARRHRSDGSVAFRLSGVSQSSCFAGLKGTLIVQTTSGHTVCLDPNRLDAKQRELLKDATARCVACSAASGGTNISLRIDRYVGDYFLHSEALYLASCLQKAVGGPRKSPGLGYGDASNGDNLATLLEALPLSAPGDPVRNIVLTWLRENAGVEQCLAFESDSPIVAGDGGRVLLATQPLGKGSNGCTLAAIDAPMGSTIWASSDENTYSTVGLVRDFVIAGTGRLLCNGQTIEGTHVTVIDWPSGNRIAEGDWGNIGLDYARSIQEYDNASPWRFRGVVAGLVASNAICLLALDKDELRGVDPSSGRLIWKIPGLYRTGRPDMLAALNAGDGFLLAIPRGLEIDLSFRRWPDGQAVWRTVLAINRLHTSDGPAVLARWRNTYWVSSLGAFRYWRIRTTGPMVEDRTLRDMDAFKWFTVDPYTGNLSIEFNDNAGAYRDPEREWRRRRDPWPYALLTPQCFGNNCGMKVAAMWRLDGDPERHVLFVNDPSVSVLTVNTRKFLSWALQGSPDRLSLLMANLERTYFEPGFPSGTRLAVLRRLVDQLGARAFKDREEAESRLRREGPQALSALEEALENGDPEITLRAKRLIHDIEDAFP